MKKTFTIIFVLLVGIRVAYTQTYPVQVTTQLLPPYSIHLSDYVASGSDRLVATVLLRDINRSELRVRLRVKIEGQGIVLQTKPSYSPPPLVLQGGLSQRLTSTDLADYFNPNNLNFIGITKRKFLQTGALPEGIYQFTIEVLEYNRNVKISNSGSTVAWLILNDPPIINTPKQAEKVRAQDPQNVVFQWTPRHTGSPNSAFSTEYEFKMVEIWPKGRNPNDAIRTSNTIFETTTQSTSLIYGIAEPTLVPGRSYAFQVRAKSIVGIDELDLFKNNGFSQVHSFTFGDPCNVPKNVRITSSATSKLKAEWDKEFNHTAYTISYREVKEGAEWFEEDTYFTDVIINSLKPDTKYEYQVRSECASLFSEYSKLYSGKTEALAITEFSCGSQANDFNLDNSELIEFLSPGDNIYAGDFDIKLDSVQGTNGIFSGGGKAQLPFLNYVKVRTVFKNIKVNTDYRVVDGNVYTYWDPNSGMMIESPPPDSDSKVEEDGEDENSEDSNTEESAVADSISINAPIDSTYNDESGNLVIVTTAGEIITVEADQEVVLTDSNGNTTTVSGGAIVSSTDENVSTGGSNSSDSSSTTSIADADMTFGPLSVKFESDPQSTETDADGYCNFKDVKASFVLNINGQYSISNEATIEGATISFKKHCENNDYKEVIVNWTNEQGLDLGDIKFLKAKLKNVALTIDSDGNLAGELGLSAFLTEDYELSQIVKVKKGITGDFSYSFENTSSFSGNFDFGGITNINLDLMKSGKVIGSVKDASLNSYGVLSGQLKLASGVISYSSSGLDVNAKKLLVDVDLSMENGLVLKSGEGEFEISNIKGLNGKLTVGLGITNGIITTSLKSGNLSGYGLTFSNLSITSIIDEQLEIQEINGSFEIKHSEFDAGIGISEFEVVDGQLTKISGSGKIVYDGLSIDISSINYISQSNVLSIDASVQTESENMSIAATISEFTIDSEGVITLGEYDVNISGTYQFGPVAVALTGDAERLKNRVGWDDYEAEASFALKMKDNKGKEVEKNLGGATLKFSKKGSKSMYKDISLNMVGSNISIGEIYSIQAAIKDVDLNITTDQDYLTGTTDDIGNIEIGTGSKVVLKATLSEDKLLGNVVKLKKGITGDFTFNFSQGSDFGGDFDFGSLSNIKLVVEKNDKAVASLTNAVIDSDLNLKGLIKTTQAVTYNSGAFDVSMNTLELDVDVNLADLTTFKINKGQGNASISNIKGVEGAVTVELVYAETGNFNANILNEGTSLTAFGMELQDLNLNADITSDLEIKKIEGTLKARHDAFNAALDISAFKIENGELKVLEANGVVNYKGFNFELEKSSYANQVLDISAKVEVETAGKLSVDNFKINKEGEISVGKIKGSLSKPMITMAFDATFKDNGFSGRFNGDVKLIALEGNIDFGMKDNYGYGYLRMAVEGDKGIPLGPTGLQLTKVGGQVGYNYKLEFANGSYTGSPLKGNYLLGLTLGISDVGNMFSAEGTSIVQFGNEKLQLSLLGSIQAPKNNPVIKSDFNVNYYMPSNNVDGTLNTDITIPASSGFVFETNTPASINFTMADEKWNIDGGVKAKMFREISFDGNTSLSKSDNTITGYLSGQASYHYYKSFNYDWSVADLTGELELGFNSQVDANLGVAGFSGKIGVHVYGNGSLTVTTIVGSISGSASVDCQADVSYTNGEGKLAGEASVVVQSTLVNFEETVEVNKTF